MINTICCIYSKLSPDDEYLICLIHVEDDYCSILTHNSGRVTQICVFNTVKLGTSASSP